VHLLEAWMKGYKPEELFDGGPRELAALAGRTPHGHNPRTNVTCCCVVAAAGYDERLPVAAPGSDWGRTGARQFLRDVLKLNQNATTSRIFGPDLSNTARRAVFEVSPRQVGCRDAGQRRVPGTGSGAGRLDAQRHQSGSWLEGYLLTGRHGLFNYGAFSASMEARCSANA
jgi:xylulose-5-phosphate/fructose-6-phosphate phosphoketolase